MSEREKPLFLLKGMYLKPQRKLKYLGIVLDDIGSFGKYTELTVNKAKAKVRLLLIRNIGNSESKKKEILSKVIHSTLLSEHPYPKETDGKDVVKDRTESGQKTA